MKIRAVLKCHTGHKGLSVWLKDKKTTVCNFLDGFFNNYSFSNKNICNFAI